MTIDSDHENSQSDEDEHENSQSDEDEDRAICPKCGLIYPDDGGFWICCDSGLTLNVQISRVKTMFQYYCEKCQV